jgi:hypothetical protein
MINATLVGKVICSKTEASINNEDLFVLNSESTFVGSVGNTVAAKG